MEDHATVNNYARWFCANWDRNIIVNSKQKNVVIPLHGAAERRFLSEMNLDKWERLMRVKSNLCVFYPDSWPPNIAELPCFVYTLAWFWSLVRSAIQMLSQTRVTTAGKSLSWKPEITAQRVIFGLLLGFFFLPRTCLVLFNNDKIRQRVHVRACVRCQIACSPAQPLQPI